MKILPQNLQESQSLQVIYSEVCNLWPEHQPFLATRFSSKDSPSINLAEDLASVILKIIGDELSEYIRSYRWMCHEFVDSELHFRRTGAYQRSTFQAAFEDVYSNDSYMTRYLKGILLSQVLWKNQTESFRFYLERFLDRLSFNSSVLEIGPGHGLLMYFALNHSNQLSVTGWDVSQSSISMTRTNLNKLGAVGQIRLECVDILSVDSSEANFDAVVISEVLEHLEDPVAALRNIRHVVPEGGLVFINVPTNSPAPDHIYLWKSAEQVMEFVRAVGFRIVDSEAIPMTGYSMQRAIERGVTVNSLVVAEKV